MSGKSPLKDKPLRLPGESVDREIDRWVNDRVVETFVGAGAFCTIAFMEWFGYLTHAPRQPILFSVLAVSAIAFGAWRISSIRGRVRNLKLGRDGERVVGQFLERLRDGGGQVFHDVPGQGFNLDHVVISARGIYTIETKTFSKPWPSATILVDGDTLTVAGGVPDHNPLNKSRQPRDGSREC
jgi:hypothetical protein